MAFVLLSQDRKQRWTSLRERRAANSMSERSHFSVLSCEVDWRSHRPSFFVKGGLFELRVLHLLGKCYATWAMSQTFFALGVFQIGSWHFFALTSLGLWSFYLCLLHSWDCRHEPPHLASKARLSRGRNRVITDWITAEGRRQMWQRGVPTPPEAEQLFWDLGNKLRNEARKDRPGALESRLGFSTPPIRISTPGVREDRNTGF
jgi:hypothetical protein